MKQKQIKSQTKTAKQPKAKDSPPKKVQKIIDEVDDEEAVVKKMVVGKKPVKKNTGKGKKFVEIVVPSEEEEEDEEDQVDDEALNDEDDGEEASDEEKVAVEEDDDQEDSDEENEAEDDDDENEAEDDDEENEAEDDDEENEAEDDEENEAEDDDDEVEKADDEVEEATIPSKVKTGIIPPSVPVTKIVVVSKLPITCKKVDIVEAFAKYGAIDQIHMVTTVNGAFANIAFKTEKAAKAALAANKVLDSIISVRLKKERKEQKEGKVVKKEKSSECVIFVRHVKTGTSVEDLKKHFESCGAVAAVKVLNKFNLTYAFITFKDKSSVPAALKLHNSILNDKNIWVLKNKNNYAKDESRYDKDLTIIVRNNESLQKLDVAKLETIFNKCGKINLIDILCTTNILAFVTFKNDKAVKNALKLNGKTEQGIKLDLDVYNASNKKTSIYVHNLTKDCTEEDLRNVFLKAGEITFINLRSGYAVIRFNETDGYCKSFLYNEVMIKGKHIFIEPLSNIKKSVLIRNNFKNNNFTNKPFKRPVPNGNSVFSAKKAKSN